MQLHERRDRVVERCLPEDAKYPGCVADSMFFLELYSRFSSKK